MDGDPPAMSAQRRRESLENTVEFAGSIGENHQHGARGQLGCDLLPLISKGEEGCRNESDVINGGLLHLWFCPLMGAPAQRAGGAFHRLVFFMSCRLFAFDKLT
jgi:hypothetical protein